MTEAIKIKNLKKHYGSHLVLKGLNFCVQQGEIFALLGVNGAGKTTCMECLEGLRKPDSGEITINGKMGIQLQSSSLSAHLKPLEAVKLFAKWNKTPIDNTMLDALGIYELAKKRYYQLSTGQKRRLHLALALTRNPDILFLDEPTAGLDIEGRLSLHKQIRHLKAMKKTIILASHDMTEVESLCDRIAILSKGRIAFIGTVDQLNKTVGKHYNITIQTQDKIKKYECDDIEAALFPLLMQYKKNNETILDIQINRGSLEQHFMKIAKGDYYMGAFLYAISLQWKLDIRSKTILITCYIVPLLFFAIMGEIFTSVMPESKYTLIQSMTVFGVTMGSFIGLPPSLVEIYSSDINKVYKANGVPLYLGLVLTNISAYIHLFIMSILLYITAPFFFHAEIPEHPGIYFASLTIFIAVSLCIASIIGLAIKDQAKTSMISIIVFLPSVMLSGIMFPIELLPKAFERIGKVFPASWGYKLMADHTIRFENLLPLIIILTLAICICRMLVHKIDK